MLELDSYSRFCCYNAVIHSIPSSRHLQRSLESISDKPAFLEAILKSQRDQDLPTDLLDASAQPLPLIESLYTSLRSKKFKLALHRMEVGEQLSSSVYENITERSNMFFLVLNTLNSALSLEQMIGTFDSIRFNANGLSLSSIVLFKQNYYISAKRTKNQWLVKGPSQETVLSNWNSFVINCFESEVVPVYLVYKRRKREIEEEQLSDLSKHILRSIYEAINEDLSAVQSDSEEFLEHFQMPVKGTPLKPICSDFKPEVTVATRKRRIPPVGKPLDVLFSSDDEDNDNTRKFAMEDQGETILDFLDELIDIHCPKAKTWTCNSCKTKNKGDRCAMCHEKNKHSPRNSRDQNCHKQRTKSTFKTSPRRDQRFKPTCRPPKRKSSCWECEFCNYINDEWSVSCLYCDRLAS